MSVYVILLPENVTPRLLNLSTSDAIDLAPTLPDGRVILEYSEDVKSQVLDLNWYSAQEIIAIRQDLESQGQSSRWWWPF
jgi:hypothetical protein